MKTITSRPATCRTHNLVGHLPVIKEDKEWIPQSLPARSSAVD